MIFNEAEKKTIQLQPLVWETIDPQRERALVGIGKGHESVTTVAVAVAGFKRVHPIFGTPARRQL